jgi:CxxC motif-containing protein (DUF1111 family)
MAQFASAPQLARRTRHRALVLTIAGLASVATFAVAADLTSEAPTGFDGVTNGFQSQDQMNLDRVTFDEAEEVDEGLGPVYNATSCGGCHGTPVTGGSSQVTELRAGHVGFNGNFVDAPGGSLINDRAIDASIQERLTLGDDIRTQRGSSSVLGEGFVEAIADSTLQDIANKQPFAQRGTIVKVPVGEAGGALRIGRFGWKDQHASLVSFSADAYLNEMGITSPLQPKENTSLGRSVAGFDDVNDPEEPPTATNPNGDDIEAFARFIRTTKAPPRDTVLSGSPDAMAGAKIFAAIGCATCHVASIQTAPAGTPINGGAFVVPPALGGKVIHPYSDFLLHDVGTGDGIVQNGGQATRDQLRTPALWGLRARDRLMHDQQTVTRTEAIRRHGGQARDASKRFDGLSDSDRSQLLTFLASL